MSPSWPVGPTFTMSNELQSMARAALASIMAQFPECVVAVVYGGRTASMLCDTVRRESQLTERGEEGATTRTVRGSAADLDEPTQGARITVAGAGAIVTATRIDPAGAVLTIEYRLERPVTGVGEVS